MKEVGEQTARCRAFAAVTVSQRPDSSLFTGGILT
jgi:hypothetical protein